MYLISPLTSQLRTASRRVAIRYVGPFVIYKIVDPHNYLLMTMDGKLLSEVFEHGRLKPTVLKTDQGNVSTLPYLAPPRSFFSYKASPIHCRTNNVCKIPLLTKTHAFQKQNPK